MSPRQPGDMRPIEHTFLACCYALIGLSAATLIVLRATDRSIDAAVTLGGAR